MKVLHQTWGSEFGGPELNSISKDRESYEKAVVYAANPDKDSKDAPIHPTGELVEITIPDDCEYARLVRQRGTMFLLDDEVDIVWGAPELKD